MIIFFLVDTRRKKEKNNGNENQRISEDDYREYLFALHRATMDTRNLFIATVIPCVHSTSNE